MDPQSSRIDKSESFSSFKMHGRRKPLSAEGQIERGEREFATLLVDSDLQERYLTYQTAAEQRQLNNAYTRFDSKYIRPKIADVAYQEVRGLEEEIDERQDRVFEAARILPDSKAAFYKVTSVYFEELNRSFHPFHEREIIRQALIEKRPEWGVKIARCLDALKKARIASEEEWQGFKQELERGVDLAALRRAFEHWGQTPGEDGGYGADGQGFHAGVLHYFAYRAFPKKAGRFRGWKEASFSVETFIRFSEKYVSMLRANEPWNEPGVQLCGLLSDEYGAKRLLLQTEGTKVVGFAGGEEPLRLVTVYPTPFSPERQRFFVEAAFKEQAGREEKLRLNHLGNSRRLDLYFGGEKIDDF